MAVKILHTADWHAGRTLHGVERTPEIREVLRVGKGQLKAFGNFKQRALVPALEEVNYWADFSVSLSYKKT